MQGGGSPVTFYKSVRTENGKKKSQPFEVYLSAEAIRVSRMRYRTLSRQVTPPPDLADFRRRAPRAASGLEVKLLNKLGERGPNAGTLPAAQL